MKASSLKWLLGMCVPVVVFGGLVAYLSRSHQREQQAEMASRERLRPPAQLSSMPPEELQQSGPFGILIRNAFPQTATAYDASQGYNLVFELRLEARGDKPSWWGTRINRSVVKTKKEVKPADCRIVAMQGTGNDERPLKTNFTVSTTYWDSTDQTYKVRLRMNGNEVKPSEEVRWRGRIAIRDAFDPPLSETVPFDVLLKVAGATWNLPKFRQESTVAIKNVKIVAVNSERHEARVTASMPGGGLQVLYVQQFLDGKGRQLTFSTSLPISHRPMLKVEQWKRNAFAANGTLSSKNLSQIDEDSSQAIFYWNPSQLRDAPRDVVVVARTTAYKTWPLEFSFPIKRNSKILKGSVPVQTRPAPIQSN